MRILISLLLISSFYLGFSQIETDRPDFTESPNVVPKGALQIETGFVLENDKIVTSNPLIGGLGRVF